MSGRAGKKPATPRGLAGPKAEKTVALALQGGGAHGAFTWGVLDQLIEDGRLAIEAITGASAGSMNAVVLVDGWREGGPEGAREQLRKFWKRVSLDGVLSPIQRTLFDQFLGFWSAGGTPAHLWLNAWSQAASPYELNPLDINPLRQALGEIIDFERVRACTQARVFVGATNVWTGKIRIFNGPELTAEHVLASACLPKIFQAVEIEGEPYWDGGYSGNPALFPLFYETRTDDIVLVQINPIERRETPRTVHEIENRLTEITFNGTLLRELRRGRVRHAAHRPGQAVEEGIQARQHASHPWRASARRIHRLLAAQRRLGLLQGTQGSRPRGRPALAPEKPRSHRGAQHARSAASVFLTFISASRQVF
jgi:NTE family protein